MAMQNYWLIVPYSIWMDFASGRCCLDIKPVLQASDTNDVISQLAGNFDQVVKQQVAGWNFWPLRGGFLSPGFSV